MLVIELTFSTGRFHATPWGRNVNEAVPEWPPSPYRLIRSLFDAWKRKRPQWDEARTRPIFEVLASEPPLFRLPPAGASHTRSYLSENKEDPQAKKLVFDGFVTLPPAVPLLIGWPDATLDEGQRADLNDLLAVMNYFGRSESWVTARLLNGVSSVDWNCLPAVLPRGASALEPVRVACVVPPAEFNGQGDKWLEALTWTTSRLIDERRSEPPALRYVDYLRPARCFDVAPVTRQTAREVCVQGVLYALESKVPAPVTQTLEVAERVRRKLMGIHARIMGDPARVSQKFSGKDGAGKPLAGHRHAYILPLDRDGDGWLDHLVIAAREPLDRIERLALDRLESVWQAGGKPDIRFTPIHWGTLPDLFPVATRLVSATPFVPPRHYRKGRGDFAEWLAAEVRREAINHGFPPPVRVALLRGPGARGQGLGARDHQGSGARGIRWLEFRRNRKDDPAQIGYGFEIEFAQPVTGPVALGYGAHFGLGQFVKS